MSEKERVCFHGSNVIIHDNQEGGDLCILGWAGVNVCWRESLSGDNYNMSACVRWVCWLIWIVFKKAALYRHYNGSRTIIIIHPSSLVEMCIVDMEMRELNGTFVVARLFLHNELCSPD